MSKKWTYEDLVTFFPGSKQTDNVLVVASLQDEQLDELADIVVFLRLNDLQSVDVVVFDVTGLRWRANQFGRMSPIQARR